VQHCLHDAGDPVEQVFGVVDAQQRPPRGQMRAEGTDAPTDDRRADRLGDRLGHRRAVAHRGEVDPPDAVRVAIGVTGGELRRQPRLPRTAGPGQGDQPVAFQQPGRGVDFFLASDERRQRCHEVVRRPGRAVAHGAHNARDPAGATGRPSATSGDGIGQLADDPRPRDGEASGRSDFTRGCEDHDVHAEASGRTARRLHP